MWIWHSIGDAEAKAAVEASLPVIGSEKMVLGIPVRLSNGETEIEAYHDLHITVDPNYPGVGINDTLPDGFIAP